MLPFRVILDTRRGATTQVVTLPRAPDIGDEITLPNGTTVRVDRVLSGDERTVSGIILALSDD